MKIDKKTDFLGKEYGPGDTVLYSCGRTMGAGVVARFTERGNTTIYPVRTSHYLGNDRTILLDRRTGARIAPHNRDHWATDDGFTDKQTGEFMTFEEHGKKFGDAHYRYQSNLKYTKHTYKDYVMEIKIMPYPVTIFNDNHVVKWEGELEVGKAEQAG